MGMNDLRVNGQEVGWLVCVLGFFLFLFVWAWVVLGVFFVCFLVVFFFFLGKQILEGVFNMDHFTDLPYSTKA